MDEEVPSETRDGSEPLPTRRRFGKMLMHACQSPWMAIGLVTIFLLVWLFPNVQSTLFRVFTFSSIILGLKMALDYTLLSESVHVSEELCLSLLDDGACSCILGMRQ